jgi:hypothetical protein
MNGIYQVTKADGGEGVKDINTNDSDTTDQNSNF